MLLTTSTAPLSLALLSAIQSGRFSYIIELIRSGINVEARDERGGMTAMMLAASSYNPLEDVVDELIKAGANVNAQSHFGNTALMVAATHQNRRVMEKLFHAHADQTIINMDGNNVMMLTAKAGGLYIFDYLYANSKLSLDTQNHKGETALHLAIQGKHVDVALRLVNAGANVHIEDNLGNKAWNMASFNRALGDAMREMQGSAHRQESQSKPTIPRRNQMV